MPKDVVQLNMQFSQKLRIWYRYYWMIY